MKKNRELEPALVPLGFQHSATFSSPWEMSDKLFKFSFMSRAFTLEMAFRGIKIYGANGSGKTSGFAKVIASSFLDHGFGGLVLCAKGSNDELENWKNLCHSTERLNSLIHFGPKNKDYTISFNILEFIRTLTENKNETQANLVKVLKLVTNDLHSGSISSTDTFWDRVTEQYLSHLLTLTMCINKGEPLNFERLSETFKMVQSKSAILAEFKSDSEAADAIAFLTEEFASLDERTSSVIIAAVSSMLFKFSSGLLKTLFGGDGNIDPRWCFGGAVIVINVPTHEYHEIGRLTNMIWKYAFQKACLARTRHEKYMRPVFLWADEAQEFIHPDDVKFQATARQSRCASVYLTQNIAGLRFNLGGGALAQDAIKALESNLVTTIFHQNIDPETNKFASDSLGTKKEKVITKNSKGFLSEESESVSYKHTPIFKTEEFLSLKTGGKTNKKTVECVVSSPSSKLFFDVTELGFKDFKKITFVQGDYEQYMMKSKWKYDVDFKKFMDVFLTDDNKRYIFV